MPQQPNEGEVATSSRDDARARQALCSLFDTAVGAAALRKVLADYLPARPTGRRIVVGRGKSATVMAAPVEEARPHVAHSGVVRCPRTSHRSYRGFPSRARRQHRERRITSAGACAKPVRSPAQQSPMLIACGCSMSPNLVRDIKQSWRRRAARTMCAAFYPHVDIDFLFRSFAGHHGSQVAATTKWRRPLPNDGKIVRRRLIQVNAELSLMEWVVLSIHGRKSWGKCIA